MTSLLEPFEVLTAARQSVGLARKPDGVDLELVAELVRRTAGLECPCSSASIVEHVVQCLYGLVDAELARRRVQEALDELVSAGDLLELEKVTTVDERARGSWLFIAPPTFVELPSGVIRILGMAAEETLPLPASLKELVERSGTRRTIPRVNDDIVPVLLAAGFRQLSVDAWLKAPRSISAKEHLKTIASVLATAPRAGAVPELRILNRRAERYSARWVKASTESGKYVARRPQAYSADLWCYVELANGTPLRLVDFPLPGGAWRGCDEAWRLQLALDAETGAPSRFQVRHEAHTVVVEVSFPPPMWAQRRFESVGDRVRPKVGVLAYAMNEQSGTAMRRYLEAELWMREADGQLGTGEV